MISDDNDVFGDDDIVLIDDGEGLAVIGSDAVVEQFLLAEGLPSRDLQLPRLTHALRAGAVGAEVAAGVAENSGRWVKLTKESAALVDKYGLRRDATSGLATGAIKGRGGQIKGFVEFAKGPGAALTNPAMLAGAAGLMSQLAMQQAMDKITDYLVVIDKKLDDVLRNQKDTALARMIGAGLIIDEAIALRAAGGRVNSVTWSKVQNAPAVIAETQSYALLQLEGLVEGLERQAKIGAVQAAARTAETQIEEWLGVLARCSQLQDAVAVIELDRVMDIDPADVDAHRQGLHTARRARIALIAQTTDDLARRMRSVAARADRQVLMHPRRAPAVVASNSEIRGAIELFEKHLGIDESREDLIAKRWRRAVSDVPSQLYEAGVSGTEAATLRGRGAIEAVRATSGGVRNRVSRRDPKNES